MGDPAATPLEDVVQRADALSERLAVLGDYLDPAALERQMAELETRMQEPGFWDDADTAAKVSSSHASVRDRLAQFRGLSEEVADIRGLAELAQADDDDDASEFVPELLAGVERAESILGQLEEARLFSDEHAAGDAVVTIHAGEGGTDAQDWAEMLLRMYSRWAERRGLSLEIKEVSEGTEAGIKSTTFTLHGENAYGLMTAERGVHRLVRLSPFDSAHRRQTSFAAVEVAPLVSDDVEVEIDDKDLKIDTYRASGAGGQHVNKTDSAVRITHLPTRIVVQCQNERSQTQNRATAMSMLRSRLVQLELERREQEAAVRRGETKAIGFGSQIRSYVIHPYTMVKDLRTGHEVGSADRVLDGDIDEFVRAELERRAKAG